MRCCQRLSTGQRCTRSTQEYISFCWQHVQLGGAHYQTADHPDREYTGAGVLLITDYQQQPTAILFHDDYKKEYEDLGGGYDPESHHHLVDTAIFEAREESANLIRIDQDFLQQNSSKIVGIIDRQPRPRSKPDEYFRLYVIKVSNFDPKLYQQNLSIIRKNLKKHQLSISNPSIRCWLETNRLSHIYLSDLFQATVTSEKVRNANGGYINLGRTRIFLDPRARTIINQVAAGPAYRLIPEQYQGPEELLEDTICYQVN